ncbi:MAG: retroviral-like aspartic protease family protein [Verrucomicrobia subdivision 3 bacterium]|nr:retroviral-like aspartic protease family protein [Limisphaerales bacterium]
MSGLGGHILFVMLLLCSGAAVLGQRQESPYNTNSAAVSFESRRGHFMVPVRVGANAYAFLLDTGYGMTMFRRDHIDALGLRRTGRVTIVGIAGEEPADVFESPTFRIGEMEWKTRRVAAYPVEQGRSRRRDGILGSAFFRRFVIEIDPSTKLLKLHEPRRYEYTGEGEVLALRFQGSTPIVEGTIVLTNGTEVRSEFEIDSGCTGALCIGKHFVEAHQLVAAGRDRERFGVGGGTRTRTGRLPKLKLGKLAIEQPAADFFLEGSPVDPPLAGHIGAGILRDFKVVFDYSRKRMILEPLKR